MGIVNESNIEAASKLFQTLASSALDERSVSGAAGTLSVTYQGADSTAIEITEPGVVPAFKRRTDEQDFGDVRMYSKTMAVQTYTAAMSLFRKQVQYDRSGSVAKALQRITSQVEYLQDKLVVEVIENNAVGLDGVALLSDTHPFGSGGGTWDNLVTSALSFDAWDTAHAFGATLQDEEGEYLDVKYDTLFVPPASRRIALEIMQADARPISVATDGVINSGGIGATGIVNVYKGAGTVIESPRLSTGTWYAIDSRYPPVALGLWMNARPFVVDDMDTEFRARKDMFLYGVDVDINACALQPWGIYGNPA